MYVIYMRIVKFQSWKVAKYVGFLESVKQKTTTSKYAILFYL